MRKNKMMRLASALLVAVLLTTCAISGTFAKYVTSADADDTARVAKWGVTASVTGSAFATVYAMDDAGAYFTNSVVSSTTDKLVAPGTDGKFTGVALTGTPEVAVNVTKTATIDIDGWVIDHDNDSVADYYYCPLRININGTEYYGMNYADADQFEAALKSAIEAANGNYEAGTNLSGITGMNGNYEWKWDFNPTTPYTDEYDTKLGDLATAPTITIDVEVVVTQID
jgi:hypothetical protein